MIYLPQSQGIIGFPIQIKLQYMDREFVAL